MTGELLSTLRQATRPLHQRIEETPISRAIVDRRIDRSTYATLVGNLASLHRKLEAALCGGGVHASVRAIFRPELCRAACAEADLAWLSAGERQGEAGERAARQVLACAKAPGALAGVVYVLEGSRLGSTVLSRRLAEALGLSLQEGHGLDYHLHRRDALSEDFRSLALGLDSLDASWAPGVVEGACATFEAMGLLYDPR